MVLSSGVSYVDHRCQHMHIKGSLTHCPRPIDPVAQLVEQPTIVCFT